MFIIAAGVLALYALVSGQIWLLLFSAILFEIGSGFWGSTMQWLSSMGDHDHDDD